ncbi:MAG: diguanylate cyclase, partial [Gallionellaceae bacterium]
MMNSVKKQFRVLVIEDFEDDFVLICNELSEGGISVIYERVETVEALKDALKREFWDVVICDHNLPALDSISALKYVRGIAGDVPFIIVSGGITDELAVNAMQIGAKDFIRKDNLSRLVPAVRRELDQATMRESLKVTQESLRKVSHYDSLTGLPNRDHLFEYLATKMSDAERIQSFAVFLIDINRFRQVTKSLGMWAGNKVLVGIAERFRVIFKESDFVARLGADTFVAVVTQVNELSQAEEVAKIIHRSMDDAFQIEGHELFIKVSIGVSFHPRDGRVWDDLLRNAESALHD